MTLTDMAKYSVPKPPTFGAVFQLIDVVCAQCGNDQITDWKDDVICTACHARVCILCGCTDDRACRDGCSWMLPGVCSTHDGDVRMAALTVDRNAARVL